MCEDEAVGKNLVQLKLQQIHVPNSHGQYGK